MRRARMVRSRHVIARTHVVVNSTRSRHEMLAHIALRQALGRQRVYSCVCVFLTASWL